MSVLHDELMRDEGLRLRVYRCTAGKLTVGVGRNLDDVGISAAETARLGCTKATAIAKGVTRAQALGLLDADIERAERDLDRELPWWRGLDEVRRRVLVNMTFNLGIRGLLGFRNTLAKVKAGSYAAAADGMMASKWAGQVGARAERLTAMMRTGAVAV